MGFTTTNSSQFLADFLSIVLPERNLREGSVARIGMWLIQNRNRMNEHMFYSDFDWQQFASQEVLLLRAITPPNVFTKDARAGYLVSVKGIDDLVELADALFGDDVTFLSKANLLVKGMGSILKTLMDWAKQN